MLKTVAEPQPSESKRKLGATRDRRRVIVYRAQQAPAAKET